MKRLQVFVPGVRLKSLNEMLAVGTLRGRFREASSARKQIADVTMMLQSRFGRTPPVGLPVRVTVTRHSPGKFDKHDNLTASAKHVVDAIAKWFGKKDDDPGFTWLFDQHKDRHYGVGIDIVAHCPGETVCACCGAKHQCVLDQGHAGDCKRAEET